MGETLSWLKAFPELLNISESSWQRTAEQAQIMNVPKGTVLFRDGDVCSGYVFVADGAIRVQKMDAQGREIVLYRVEDGQTCMLTTSCLIGGEAYPAEGIAETDVTLAMLPAPVFEKAMSNSADFRRFVLASIGRRIGDLMVLVEDVAFGRMDVRLARLLLKRSGELDAMLCCTHQELATELGTAREVISRLLKDFERKGWVLLSRGQVEIKNSHALAELHEE
ncbi:MAG: Crp/Fnr family transcriptional regulator [Mariprofundaceae bacterium]